MADAAKKIQSDAEPVDQELVPQDSKAVVETVTRTIYTSQSTTQDTTAPSNSSTQSAPTSAASAGQTDGNNAQSPAATPATSQSGASSPVSKSGSTSSNQAPANNNTNLTTQSSGTPGASVAPTTTTTPGQEKQTKKSDPDSANSKDNKKEADNSDPKKGKDDDAKKGQDESQRADEKKKQGDPESTDNRQQKPADTRQSGAGKQAQSNPATQAVNPKINAAQRPAGTQPNANQVQALPASSRPNPQAGRTPAQNGLANMQPGQQNGRPGARPYQSGANANPNRKKLDGKDRPTSSDNKPAKTQENSGNNKVVAPKSAPTKAPTGSTGGPKGNLKQQAVKETVGKVVEKVGTKLGLSGVQNQFIMHLCVLVIELLTGIGTLVFIFHVLWLVFWVLKKDRWKEVKAMLIPFILIGGGGMLMMFMTYIVGFSVVACTIGEGRLPYGISMGTASRIGAVTHSDTGAFAQLCDKLNLVTAGVGGASAGSSGSSRGGTTASSNTAASGVAFVDSTTLTDTPIIADTLLTRPQSLPPEFAIQTNQAGYVSPAQCKLSDLPYSTETSLQRVALPDGSTTVITLPIHQTVDCTKVDSTLTAVKSIHIGKIIRLVYADPTLGDYATVEYPNNLRVSYYHLRLLPELTLGKTLNAGEKIGDLAQTGGNTFEGVKMLFEYKDTGGSWQAFNPINAQAELSILTTFPCADDANKRCLLQ